MLALGIDHALVDIGRTLVALRQGLVTESRIDVLVFALLLGCDSNEPSMADALKKADEAEAKKKAEEAKKKAAVKVEKKVDPTANPWTIDALKASMKMGMVATYAISGVDAKGKEVTDEYVATVKGNDDSKVRVNTHRVSKKDDPVSSQVKTLDWSQLSPFFYVERAESQVLGRESVQVAAGSFECAKVEIKGFFGAHLTAWMIVDQPGVYAKVEEHANANEEGDQTALVYELQSVQQGG